MSTIRASKTEFWEASDRLRGNSEHVLGMDAEVGGAFCPLRVRQFLETADNIRYLLSIRIP